MQAHLFQSHHRLPRSTTASSDSARTIARGATARGGAGVGGVGELALRSPTGVAAQGEGRRPDGRRGVDGAVDGLGADGGRAQVGRVCAAGRRADTVQAPPRGAVGPIEAAAPGPRRAGGTVEDTPKDPSQISVLARVAPGLVPRARPLCPAQPSARVLANPFAAMGYGDAPWTFTGRCVFWRRRAGSRGVGGRVGGRASGLAAGKEHAMRRQSGPRARRPARPPPARRPRTHALPLLSARSALYQLQLVPVAEARKYVPDEFKLVSLFGRVTLVFWVAWQPPRCGTAWRPTPRQISPRLPSPSGTRWAVFTWRATQTALWGRLTRCVLD